ncbi:hypothetical protein H8F21_02595 [Pseudomonas sp. P66]|uniref:Antitoxin Xre/MbcA/ParS-like toxin-binding domain-containing protein n=1 Tax=Pseudomonas arcuscaelestis TaxID=2710591 RepID=A0ABS2BS58_9PSED|nr:hypothetical protein [Pseudomonas arcuscaelestis]MBM5456453.1 hypothetical protein [Pseudomonas arcuscaelestis]
MANDKSIGNHTAAEAAFSILNAWGVNGPLANGILGSEDCSDSEVLYRAGLIMEISRALQMIFENPKNAEGFMTMKNHNHYFLGMSPIERIADGSLVSLEECAKRIRALATGELPSQ